MSEERATCKHCGGRIAERNPTGKCDHLFFPEMLTAAAKIANGFCDAVVDSTVVDEILRQWDAVKADRANAQEALANTGSGESPWHPATEEAWRMREHCLARTLIAAMPMLEDVLRRGPNEANIRRTRIPPATEFVLFSADSWGRQIELSRHETRELAEEAKAQLTGCVYIIEQTPGS